MIDTDALPKRQDFGRMRGTVAGLMAVMLAFGTVPTPAFAQTSQADVVDVLQKTHAKSREIRDFYADRGQRPLWIENGAPGRAAQSLLRLIETAEIDGLDPGRLRLRNLQSAVDRATDGSPKDVAKAELALSETFVAFARAMQKPVDVGMVYADPELAPLPTDARQLLERAAAARSLDDHVANLGWMHPLYGKLRQAAVGSSTLLDGFEAAPAEWEIVRTNLKRLRALPADPGRRHVLVDAAAARLWMYRDGKVEGTMRVVVGKPSEPTPMMAGLIRYASLNPYWNIPPDLVRIRVAPGAATQGAKFLKAKRWEVLADWSEGASVIDPAMVNWKDVASGRADVRVRQLPGPGNPMGRIKFMFPNEMGIYLHDTPEKSLLRESDRLFSSGCVRVEDAPRLARWLFGKPVPTKVSVPEKQLDLDQPVPVYITYLTAAAQNDRIAFREDVYGRDGSELARLKNGAPRG